LKLAMQNFSHAAEYFLQANKLTRAMQAASQAELVALQISLAIGVANGQTVDCLFEQDQTQVTNLITTRLRYLSKLIICRAGQFRLFFWSF
jgi:Spatacsin C-terminus